MQSSLVVRLLVGALKRSGILVGALALTALLFMVLPLIQAINAARDQGELYDLSGLAEPPPPPPMIEETPPEEEEEQEPEPPKLDEAQQNLDLDALTLALESSMSGGFGGAAIAAQLSQGMGDGGQDNDALFSMADLDQRPRVIYQPSPQISEALKKRGGGKVSIIFIVDASGRVERPKVHQSSDPLFDRAALDAVKKWKFEPGRRNGKPVRFRMRVPITFPDS